MKKKRAIVTGGSSNHIPAMGVLVLNILESCPDFSDDIIIYHDAMISEDDKRRIRSIYPVIFKEYDTSCFQREAFNRTVWHHFSFMLFCKYECWNLLDEYEQVMWLDYDIYIYIYCSELFDLATPAMFMNSISTIRKFNDNVFTHLDALSDVDLVNVPSVSCGTFVLSDTFPSYRQFYQDCLRLTNELSDCLTSAEEAVISVLLQRYHVTPTPADSKIYCFNPKRGPVPDTVKIVHIWGQQKFWNGFRFKPWERLYQKWQKDYGGRKVRSNGFRYKAVLRDILPYGIVTRILKRK